MFSCDRNHLHMLIDELWNERKIKKKSMMVLLVSWKQGKLLVNSSAVSIRTNYRDSSSVIGIRANLGSITQL